MKLMDSYIEEGYRLMTKYITDERIKTRNRKFLRRLDKFYKKYTEKDTLTLEEEREYLELEKEFYTTILPAPETPKDKASLEVLNILTQSGKKKKEE